MLNFANIAGYQQYCFPSGKEVAVGKVSFRVELITHILCSLLIYDESPLHNCVVYEQGGLFNVETS